jgi:3-deoxy-7-phosphoheptulonate synthase
VQSTKAKINQQSQAENDSVLQVVQSGCPVTVTENSHCFAAARLAPLVQQYSKELVMIMRVYFEKPRTTVGWKGLINDPDLDGSYHINKGLRIAREVCRHEFLPL